MRGEFFSVCTLSAPVLSVPSKFSCGCFVQSVLCVCTIKSTFLLKVYMVSVVACGP